MMDHRDRPGKFDTLKETLAHHSTAYRTLVYKYRSYRDNWSFPATMAHTTGYKMVTHNYEPEVTAQIQSILQPGDHFLDIGANIGYYSMLAAELSDASNASEAGNETGNGIDNETGNEASYEMGNAKDNETGNEDGNETGNAISGRQVAVEMEPENYRCLAENLSSRPHATPLHCAVSDTCGTISFYRSLHSSCHSLHDTDNLIDRSASQKEHVRCVTIDHIWQEHFDEQPVKLMKMDVEGAELQALQGGSDAFSSGAIANVIVEYCPRAMQNAGQDTSHLYELLSEWFLFGVMEHLPGLENQHAHLQPSDFDRLTDLLLSTPGTANCNLYGTSRINP